MNDCWLFVVHVGEPLSNLHSNVHLHRVSQLSLG